MKHEWRKKEKAVYLPGLKPEVIDIPTYKFVVIDGEGNPNSPFFSECIGALYAISYALKMNLKKESLKPDGYYDYTVYPLEGVWDLNEEAKKNFNGVINKDDFVFRLMIRQPHFITDAFFNEMLELTKKKKPNLLENLTLESIKEGKCIQMMHVGNYDNEPESFQLMEEFADQHHLIRASKAHREIYLSDFRKVEPEKLKTVLRFQLTHSD